MAPLNKELKSLIKNKNKSGPDEGPSSTSHVVDIIFKEAPNVKTIF